MHSRAVDAVARRSALPSSVRILVFAGFLVAIGYGIVAPVLPTYARSFGVGITAASVVVSAFAVFRLVFAPMSGVLVRLLGDLRVFCAGLLVVALSSVACAFATDFIQLLTFRSLGGIGSTMFTVSAAALLIKISPPSRRGRSAGAYATGFLAGSIGGPLVGGVLVGLGPRAPFLAYGGVLVVVIVIAASALRVPARHQSECGSDDLVTPSVVEALRHPTFRAALASNFVNGWTVYGVRVALVPLFVVERLGATSNWSGIALTAFAVGTAGTALLGGRLADVHGRRPIILIGLIVVAISTGWLGFTTSPTELVIAALVSGAGTGITNPPTNAAVADVVAQPDGGNNAGPALAAYQMVGDVGAIVGPVLAGLVADMSGYPMAFALTAAVAVAACTSWWRASETAGSPNLGIRQPRHGP